MKTLEISPRGIRVSFSNYQRFAITILKLVYQPVFQIKLVSFQKDFGYKKIKFFLCKNDKTSLSFSSFIYNSLVIPQR
jgi:hypothetical protein